MKKPKYYYEWGNEPAGHVSTYYVDDLGDVVCCETMPKEEAWKLGLKFDCPFP